MGTRRCDRREFLALPDHFVNWIVSYLLGYQQTKHQLNVSFFIMMGNHYHGGFEDRKLRIDHSVTAHFMRDFNSLSARALNAYRERSGAFWSGGGDTFNFVRNPSTEDLIESAVYGLTNPVAAGLVSHRKKWPGLLLDPGPTGKKTIKVRRPPCFFSGYMPAEVEVTLEAPRCELSPRAFMKEVYRRANLREHEIRQQMKSQGRTFLGVKAVRRQSPFDQPKTKDPWRRSRPLFSARDPLKRRELIQRNRAFLEYYEACRDAFRAGLREVDFPLGTFKVVAFYGAVCSGRDPPL